MLWYAAVLSLPQVLHEALRHNASEIVVEVGHAATMFTNDEPLIVGDALVESDISEAISQVLTPEQQAELLVAGVVEFSIEGYKQWAMIAETGADGIVVRGRLREDDGEDAVGAPLELPPFERFDPERQPEMPPRPEGSVLQSGEARSTRWDVGVAGAVAEEIPRTISDALTDPTLDEAPLYNAGTAAMPATENGLQVERDEGPVDFALVGRAGPTADFPEVDDPATGPTMAPRLNKRASRPTIHSNDPFVGHVDTIGPGSVVYMAGVGVAERLLQHFDEGYEIIDESTWDTVTTRLLDEMPPGGNYLVRLEDPSRCLGWLLRRLEEGARLVIESRSRTAEGVRRMLLGTEATPQTAMWLDAHPQLWLFLSNNTWTLEPL